MKSQEMREQTTAELTKQLDDSFRELFNLRFRLATRQLDNHREIPKVKRNIARLKTILRERELAAQSGEE